MYVAVATHLVIEGSPDADREDRQPEANEEEDQPLLTGVAVCRTAHSTLPL